MANPDDALRGTADRLIARLRREQRGNFVQARVIRDPDPRYALHFRRNAAATLRRYSRDPRFVAIEGGVTASELQPGFDRWAERFTAERIPWHGGVQPHEGAYEISIGASLSQFEAIARARGWPADPRLRLRFAPEPSGESTVTPSAAGHIRAFPRLRYAPGLVPAIASGGRVVLRDGCFRVLGFDGRDRGLAVFARDARLSVDEQGYLIVVAPSLGRPPARIGEDGAWGFEEASDTLPPPAELHARCGAGALVHVGIPASAARTGVSWWSLDQYARSRGFTRERAWAKVRACWAERHSRPSPLPSNDLPEPGETIRWTDCDHALGRVPFVPPPPPPPVRR